MGATEFRKALAAFSQGRQCVDGPEEIGCARAPKNPPTQQRSAAKRVSGRSLLTQADIQAAVDWRLAGIPADEIESIARALDPFADDFREDRPEVAAVLSDLRRPGERRDPWALACAVLAVDALRHGDAATFIRAGFEVVGALMQSQRRKRAEWKMDALDVLIAAESMPADRLFAEFISLARTSHHVLADYDEDADALVCKLDPNDEQLTDISRQQFSSRVARARRAI